MGPKQREITVTPITRLHGIEAPPCDGMVVEVHLDMMDAPNAFLRAMEALGFENDPFLDFYPAEYCFHYTGRTRALPNEMHAVLPGIDALIEHVLEEARAAGVKLYVESELVREIRHIDSEQPRSMTALDGLLFTENRSGGVTKADVHVEFCAGTVPPDVRALLLSKQFYWVRTPAFGSFPSEEIATLQPSQFTGAQQVFERLVALPFPACTGVHLEQKLVMTPSFPGLPLPTVFDVSAAV